MAFRNSGENNLGSANVPRESYLSFSHNIREFIKKCREEQTLFANMEGQYERRCFKLEEQGPLIEYVSQTLYSGSGLDIPNAIVKKMMELNGRKGNEIYCSNIWLCFYEYNSKTTYSIPLFKIFKGKEADDFFLLDTKLHLYNNFEHCINEINLPLSFFCVPRHGRYSFINEKLNLEFICSNKNLSDFPREPNCVLTFIPYSQRIKSCIFNFKWLPVLKDVFPIAVGICELFVGSNTTLACILCLLNRILTFLSSNQSLTTNEFDNDMLMMCDVKENMNAKEDPQDRDKEHSEMLVSKKNKLLDLIKNPKGNEEDIILIICEKILDIPDPMCFLRTISIGNPNWVTAITVLICVLKLMAKAGTLIIQYRKEEGMLENRTVQEIISTEFPTYSGALSLPRRNKPCRINYKAALQNLSQLSTMPASSFENLYTEKPTPETETYIEILSSKDGFHFLGVEKGKVFFVITNSSPVLLSYCAEVFNAVLKPLDRGNNKLIKKTPKGVEIGVLHQAFDFVTLGWVYQNELPEGLNVEERIERPDKRLRNIKLYLNN